MKHPWLRWTVFGLANVWLGSRRILDSKSSPCCQHTDHGLLATDQEAIGHRLDIAKDNVDSDCEDMTTMEAC